MNREALKEQEISGALLKENARLRAGIDLILTVAIRLRCETIVVLCTKLLAGEAIDD